MGRRRTVLHENEKKVEDDENIEADDSSDKYIEADDSSDGDDNKGIDSVVREYFVQGESEEESSELSQGSFAVFCVLWNENFQRLIF